MSVDIRQHFPSAPLKSARETISLFPNDVSKCGELFVTNNADKWTFFCGYCEEVTSDIGVFICHIRLEHLNTQTALAQQQQLPQQSQVTPQEEIYISTTIASSNQSDASLTGVRSTIQNPEVLQTEEGQSLQIEIIKEEETMANNQEYFQTICSKVSKNVDITSLMEHESGDMGNLIVDKNSSSKLQHNSAEISEEVIAITPIALESQQQELISEIVKEEVVYVENEVIDKTECDDNTVTIENDQDDDDADTVSRYSPSDDDENEDNDYDDDIDFEMNNIHKAITNSQLKRKRIRGTLTDSTDSELKLKCPYCPSRYRNKNSLSAHISLNHHNKLTIKCEKCNRNFRSKNGLKVHLKSHHEDTFLICPICPTKHIESQFITHVLTHESDTCFPCQVCGKVYDSNNERMKHWKTHAKEKPYTCRICYRRFESRGLQGYHRKQHRKYHCNFCAAEFNTTETQQPPYICPACEKSGVKKKADGESLLANENFIPPHHTSAEIKGDVCITTTIRSDAQGLSSKTDKEVVNVQNEATDKTEYDDDIEIIENIQDSNDDTVSRYSSSEDDENNDNDDVDIDIDDIDFEINDVDKATTNSKPKRKRMQKIITDSTDSGLELKCPYCPSRYKGKNNLSVHISLYHRNKLIKCEKCHRGFLSKNGLKVHLKSHDEDTFLVCPVCPTKHMENQFITHVLTHESDTCFPCQVCGKVYDSNKERMKHWETHAKEKPFPCRFCYRRFESRQHLKNHIKIHKRYQCQVCAAEFNTTETQQPPFVCPVCEKSGVKKKAGGESRWENENSIATLHLTSAENNGDVFTITQICSEEETQELSTETGSKEVVKIVKVKNEATDKTEYDVNTETIDNYDDISITFYSLSEDHENDDDSNDTDFKVNDSHKTGGSIKPKEKSMKNTFTSSADSELSHKCPHCPMLYQNKRSIRTHIMLNHQEILQFKCKKCNRGFNSKSGLKFHQNYHNENKILRCPICATEHTENQFTTHVLTHESATCFPCQVCGKVHACPEARKKHWKTHAKEKPFHCRFCYRRFDSRTFLARHRKSHKEYRCRNSKTKKKPDNRRLLTTEEAFTEISDQSSETGSKQIIKNDESNANSSNTQYDTDDDVLNEDLDLEFIDESGYDNIPSSSSKSPKTIQMKITPQGESKLLQKCKYCRKRFASRKGLIIHTNKVHFKNVKKWYECLFCDKIYEARSSLFFHEKSHNESKKFQCPLCPLAEDRQSVFANHVMKHENESCFPCQVCGKIFSTNSERSKHWETHIQERPHGCNICYRRFHHGHQLKYHLKLHGVSEVANKKKLQK